MDDDVQDLLGIEGGADESVLNGNEEFLLAHLTGTEAVCGIGLNDAVEHQGQVHILTQVVVEGLLPL